MGSQGGPAPRRGRAAPPISSSPWLLQREGKHPLSCTSYSLPPAEDPQLIPSGDQQGLDSSAPRSHACVCVCSSCSAGWKSLHLIRSSSGWHPAERLMAPSQASGRHSFLQPEYTYRERMLGVTGLPRKVQGTEELVSCIWPSALALFPTCRVFQLCLVARLTHPGFRLNQLIGEAGDPCQPAQSKSSGDGM